MYTEHKHLSWVAIAFISNISSCVYRSCLI